MKQKRLYRSSENQLIAGVVAGVAEYFDHDPTLWRLAVAFVVIVTGIMPGVLMYFVAWIIIPLRTEDESTIEAEVIYEQN